MAFAEDAGAFVFEDWGNLDMASAAQYTQTFFYAFAAEPSFEGADFKGTVAIEKLFVAVCVAKDS